MIAIGIKLLEGNGSAWSGSNIWAANAFLSRQLKLNAPQGCYIKTRIEVTGFPQIGTYSFRYDLGSEDGDSEGLPNIAARVVSGIKGMIKFKQHIGQPYPPEELENLRLAAQWIQDVSFSQLSEAIEKAGL